MRRLHVDRLTVMMFIGAVAFIAAYSATVALSNRYYVVSAPPSSVYSASPAGFKVYYTYLRELGLKPGILKSFETLPAHATLIVAGPFQKSPSAGEAQAIGRWVRGGGRLVTVGADARELLDPIGLGGSPNTGDASETLRPLFPGAYADGVTALQPGPDRLLLDESAWVAHFKDFGGQVLVSRKVDAGEVVWFSGPFALSNAGIGRADNGRLSVLLAAAGGRGVYFDEFHHGYVEEPGYWDRLPAGGRSAVLLLAAALAIALIGWSRRIGPVIEPLHEAEARGGAYIGQLAELYRKAGARAEALSALEDGLTHALARTHGTLDAGLARHPDARDALTASRALREAGAIPEDRFLSTARRLSRARQEVEGQNG